MGWMSKRWPLISLQKTEIDVFAIYLTDIPDLL